jgi:hypothetical protein
MNQLHVNTTTTSAERPSGIHAVGRADAGAEREADRFADASVAPLRPGPGWSFANVPVHAESRVAARPEAVDVRLDGHGRPLEPDERMPLPPGVDARTVRVHTDASAADTVARAGADAVTIGTHIAFATGRYQPATAAGRRRLVHELAHVGQQREGAPALIRRVGNAPVAPATTLAGLPEADRKRLQVVTTTTIAAPTAEKLKDSYFDPGTTINPPVAVAFDASVPAALTKGLTNLVGDWTSGATPTLTANSTFTLGLDLTAHGGTKAPFRFTFTQPPAAKGQTPGGRIIVEQLGAATPPAGTTKPPAPTQGRPAPPDPIADKLAAASITHSGYSAREEEALRAAISVTPAAHLAAVTGLTFRRGGVDAKDPKVAGRYDPKTHRITMYDLAFASTAVAFVEGSTSVSYAARSIVHEIGHAVDLRPLQQAYLDLEAARKAVNDASGTFTSAAEANRYRDAVKAEKAAIEKLKTARGRSGSRTVEKAPAGKKPDPTAPKDYEDVIGTEATGNAFREAAKRDGKPVSTYGEEDWQESYAEAYSLFLSNPSQLKALRPATYAYLQQNLPK